MLGLAILLNMLFGLLCFCSIIVGCFIYLKTGVVPPMHEALSFSGWNISKLYSSTYVGYNEIIQNFLETNFIYGSLELLFVSLGITWVADLVDSFLDKFTQKKHK